MLGKALRRSRLLPGEEVRGQVGKEDVLGAGISQAGEPEPRRDGHGEVSRQWAWKGRLRGLACAVRQLGGAVPLECHCVTRAGRGSCLGRSRGRGGGDCGKQRQEAACGSKQPLRPYLTSFLSSEKSLTCWGAGEEHVLSWQLQPHVLEWKKLGCLQAASCQAFRVTLRGPVCAFGFQDECGPGRETPRPPPSAWVSQPPRQCSLG